MELLRNEDINKDVSLTETSNDKIIVDSGAETESRLGDPAVDLETSEAWPDHQGRDNKETSGKRLRWLHVIGENTSDFFAHPSLRDVIFMFDFREEDPALRCDPCRNNICSICSNFLF